MVQVKGCPARDGVLISGVAKPTKTKTILKFPVRFPNGDVRTYPGNQLTLRGSQAPLLEFIRVGDIIFTKSTLGVVRFIGLHEDFVGTIIVLEPIDPKLPTDPNVDSFRKLFPSANLSDHRAYNIIRHMEEIVKVVPPDTLLQQLSKIKDKYLSYVEDSREKERAFEEDMNKWTKKITDLEEEIKQQNEDMKVEETSSDADASLAPEESNMKQILFQPGYLGIKAMWVKGVIEGVSPGGQAEALEVKAGWVIVKIDDEDYSEARLDSRTQGKVEYTMTFQTNVDDYGKTNGDHAESSVKPKKNLVPLNDMLMKETEKETYERKIQEHSEQIEQFQYTIEELETKNLKMEQDYEGFLKLRGKVEQLRTSRVIFKSQIQEFQKRLKEAKQKADHNESKFKQTALELKSAEKNSPLAQAPKGRNEGNKPTRRHNRKPSVSMPKPEPARTVSLGGKPVTKIGDGSAETVSLSDLNLNGKGKVADGKNPKKNNGINRLSSFFGGKKSTGQQQPRSS